MSNNVNINLRLTVDHTADSDLIAMLKRLAAAGELALHGLAKLAVTEQETRFEARDEIVRQAVQGLDPFIRQRVANYIDDKMLKERLKLRPVNANPVERLAEDIAASDEAPESPVAKTGVPEPSETPTKPARVRTQRQKKPKTPLRSPQDADFDPESPEWVPMSKFADETDHGYQKLVKWANRTSKSPTWFRSHVESVPGKKNVRYHVHKSSYEGA